MRQRIIDWLGNNFIPFTFGYNQIYWAEKNGYELTYDINLNRLDFVHYYEKELAPDHLFNIKEDDAYELIIEIFGI